MLKSDLYNYSDAYILVKRRITVEGNNANNQTDKTLTFKNNVPFRSCIANINNTFTDNVKDLDIVMAFYNLLLYSDNYSMASGSLWGYYRDEVNNDAHENNVGGD